MIAAGSLQSSVTSILEPTKSVHRSCHRLLPLNPSNRLVVLFSSNLHSCLHLFLLGGLAEVVGFHLLLLLKDIWDGYWCTTKSVCCHELVDISGGGKHWLLPSLPWFIALGHRHQQRSVVASTD